jgi:hypothetical protein
MRKGRIGQSEIVRLTPARAHLPRQLESQIERQPFSMRAAGVSQVRGDGVSGQNPSPTIRQKVVEGCPTIRTESESEASQNVVS